MSEDWKALQVGDFCEVSAGGTPDTSIKEYWEDGNIPWMSSGEVHKQRIKETESHITTLGLHNSSAKFFPKDSVLVALAGQGKTRGKVAISEIELTTNQSIAAIIARKDICDPEFLYYNLSNRYEELRSLSGGSGRAGLNLSILSAIEIYLPPLPEQKKIAEILSGIDNLVRSLTEHNQKLEATKTALSKELISGHSGHRKESPYGQIPEHWIESTLGGIIGMANLQTGPFGSQLHAHEYTTEGIPVVMPQDMRKCGVVTDKIARITPDRAQTLEKHKVSPGDILFSRRGDIGRHAIISSNESGWICGTGCLRARTDGAINPIFLSELLRHKYALEWLNANAVGQTMLNLNTGILADLPVVVPPADEQEKIANSLSSINEQTRRIANKIWHTQNLKAAVASDLLSGRNRVSV